MTNFYRKIGAGKGVCLITAVGPGTGSALVERFVAGGYEVAMLARDEQRLNDLSARYSSAHAFVCDVGNPDRLATVFKEIETSLGAPAVILHNAVAVTLKPYLEIGYEELADHFRTNTLSPLQLAQLATPAMAKRGQGAIVCTGNTAAFRGKANYAGFAPMKAAQRILLESIVREGGPKGIHAAYVGIDAVIAVPWALERFIDTSAD